MNKNLKLIPIWLWVTVIIIIVLLCSSCRGGRSLGKGSAGTVIVPQTPQEINEKNSAPRPPLEPLPPMPISIAPAPPKNPTVTPTPVAPPVAPPAAPLESVRSTPTLPESKSAEANPVIINPKPAGKLKPFSPSVSSTPKLIITDSEKNGATDNAATNAPEEKSFINWSKLTYYYLFLFIALIFGWIVYDIVQTYRLRRILGSKTKIKTKRKTIKKPAKASRESRKKTLSKKDEKTK